MFGLEVIKFDETSLEVEVKGETFTLFSPLVEYLSNDPDVEYVQFDVGHPLLENAYFKVRVKRGSPLEVVERAVRSVLNDLEGLERGFFP